MRAGGILTKEEKAAMRWAFDAGFSAPQTAQKLGRSLRSVERYFAFYSGKPWVEHDRRPPRCNHWPGQLRCGVCGMSRKPLQNPSRFYASEFEPT
jgi:hypothetical protein